MSRCCITTSGDGPPWREHMRTARIAEPYLSLDAAAALAGIGWARYAAIETGRADPTEAEAEAIYRAIGVRP